MPKSTSSSQSSHRSLSTSQITQHAWTQDDESIQVKFRIPKTTDLESILIDISPLQICVRIKDSKNAILEGNFLDQIIPSTLRYSTTPEVKFATPSTLITLTVEKKTPHVPWMHLLKPSVTGALDPWSMYTYGRSTNNNSLVEKSALMGVEQACWWLWEVTGETKWLKLGREMDDPCAFLVSAQKAQQYSTIQSSTYYTRALRLAYLEPTSLLPPQPPSTSSRTPPTNDNHRRLETLEQEYERRARLFCNVCFSYGVHLFEQAPFNRGVAVSYWQQAALFGHRPSLYNLGIHYLSLNTIDRAKMCFWASGKSPDVRMTFLIQRLEQEHGNQFWKTETWRILIQEWSDEWKSYWNRKLDLEKMHSQGEDGELEIPDGGTAWRTLVTAAVAVGAVGGTVMLLRTTNGASRKFL